MLRATVNCSTRDVPPLIPTDALRILLSVAMLGYTSWSDLRTREVSDLNWIVFGGLGLVLDIYETSTGVLNPMALAVPILFSTALSFFIGYLGLFGGADFKAFVALALLQPHPPHLVKPMLKTASVIYPLTVLSNSALAGASFAVILLVRNLSVASAGSHLFEGLESERPWMKLIVLISGMKVKLDTVRGPPFQYPLEVPALEEGAGRKLVMMPDLDDDEAAQDVFEKLRLAGVEEVWVSHTLPFLVFIAFGYVSALLVGDVALWMIMRLLSL